MRRIGDLLLESGACTLEALHVALENQVLFGGRLGTNLIETGGISEEALASALGARYGVAWAAGDDLTCERSALALVPGDVADRCNAVPLRLAGRRLQVCCLDPGALGVLDELAFVSGKEIEPVVVSETRLIHLLRACYGVDRHLRAVAMRAGYLRPLAHEPAAGPRSRAFDPIAGKVVEHDGPPLLGAPDDEEAGEAEAGEAEGAAGPAAAPARPREPPPLELPALTRDLLARLALERGEPIAAAAPSGLSSAPVDLHVALTAIATASDREAVHALLVRYACGRFHRVALFTLEGGLARGAAGRTPGVSLDGLRNLTLALEDPGIVAAAVLHGQPVDGPLAHVQADWQLVQVLGGGMPLRGLAIPVHVGGRIVKVIYADRGPGDAHDHAAADDLARVAEAAGRRCDQLAHP